MRLTSLATDPLPAVAILARSPSPGKTKTRLIPLLGAPGAAAFQAALISDTVRKVNALAGRTARYFFLAGRDFPAFPTRSAYTFARQQGRDLGERLERAFATLLRCHPRAVIIGTDSPLLPASSLRVALHELRYCDAVLGPCPDGGYYLIGLRCLEAHRTAGMFEGIRWGTRFAFRDTLRNLLRRNCSCSILELHEDVDRPEDFRRLARQLARSAAARRVALCEGPQRRVGRRSDRAGSRACPTGEKVTWTFSSHSSHFSH